jgi:uncharacterized membrane protein YecN with MAPEG domain
MPLEIAASYAAVLVRLTAALALNVSYGRLRHGIPHGEGPNRELARAIRAHMNSVEHSIPVALLLVSYALLAGDARVIAALGTTTVLARVLLSIGILLKGAFSARRIGALTTYAVEGLLAVLILVRTGARLF